MNDIISRQQLLETLKARRAEWDALLAAVGEEHLTESGAAGHWSVKDIVCHVTAYERRLVEWLAAAAHGTFPGPSPLDDADIERRNARAYELTHAMSLSDALNDARRTFAELLEIIQALPDVYFDDSHSAEWFMKPYWSKMKTMPGAVINLSAGHYDEHIPVIQVWIKRSKE